MRIVSNKLGGRVVLHFTANGSAVIVGNSSVSNVASPGEDVVGATISQVWYGAGADASWTISRGANTVGAYFGSDHVQYASHGVALTLDSTANLAVSLSGGVGYVMVELTKQSNIGSQG